MECLFTQGKIFVNQFLMTQLLSGLKKKKQSPAKHQNSQSCGFGWWNKYLSVYSELVELQSFSVRGNSIVLICAFCHCNLKYYNATFWCLLVWHWGFFASGVHLKKASHLFCRWEYITRTIPAFICLPIFHFSLMKTVECGIKIRKRI